MEIFALFSLGASLPPQLDSFGLDALSHALRFDDRRVRLQMVRVLVGRGFHLPPDRRHLIAWIERHSPQLLASPWSLLRLLLTALITTLVLPNTWGRLIFKGRALAHAAAADPMLQAMRNGPLAQGAAPQEIVMKALQKLDSMSRSLLLVDLARDAVRRQLVRVTKERVLRLPLPAALHSHVLLETTFADMEKDELGLELETLDLRPTSDRVKDLGGVEDWPAIEFLSARR